MHFQLQELLTALSDNGMLYGISLIELNIDIRCEFITIRRKNKLYFL